LLLFYWNFEGGNSTEFDIIANNFQIGFLYVFYILLVRFLFEGEVGRILYTGDFRLWEGDASRFCQFHYLDGTVKEIDKLYLDTTFLSRRYLQFPSRTVSISILCNYIISWLQGGPDNDIYIQTAGNEM
jgi:hypothetical protein